MSLSAENLKISVEEYNEINRKMIDAVKSIIEVSKANANGKEGKKWED